MRRMKRLALFVGSMFAAATVQAASVTPAQITGPIPVTAESGEPYRRTNEQAVADPELLIPYGYVEEEYFVSGTVDGKPYTTSLLVRKPKDPKQFSGLVALETVHAQGGMPLWGQHDVWLSGGHGWVAVGSQRAALEQHIKKSNATRYASLQIPEAAPATGIAAGSPLTGGPQARISEEILTQVGALLKSNAKNGPFAGMTVKYLIMGGASQTGSTTIQYIVEAHASAHMSNGKPIYDGYLPMASLARMPMSAPDAAIIHVVNEGDFTLAGVLIPGASYGLRADSNAANDRYREYEIAAAAHASTRGWSDPRVPILTLGQGAGADEHLSQFASGPIYEAIAAHLVNWIMNDVSPPHARPIEVLNGAIVRDEFGNAKGGVRSAYVDVPTARYIASAPDEGNSSRRMLGLQEPFSADKLQALYKSRENYLKLFDASIDKMVKARFLRPADAQTLKDEEAKSPPL